MRRKELKCLLYDSLPYQWGASYRDAGAHNGPGTQQIFDHWMGYAPRN